MKKGPRRPQTSRLGLSQSAPKRYSCVADRRRSGDPAPTPACANGGKAPTAPSCKPSLIMALIKRRSSREQACAVASAAPASGAGSGWDVCVPAPGVGAAWVRKGPESREQRSGAGSASPPMPSSGGTRRCARRGLPQESMCPSRVTKRGDSMEPGIRQALLSPILWVDLASPRRRSGAADGRHGCGGLAGENQRVPDGRTTRAPCAPRAGAAQLRKESVS